MSEGVSEKGSARKDVKRRKPETGQRLTISDNRRNKKSQSQAKLQSQSNKPTVAAVDQATTTTTTTNRGWES